MNWNVPTENTKIIKQVSNEREKLVDKLVKNMLSQFSMKL